MTAFATWSDSPELAGNVLAIVNVEPDDRDAATALFDRLEGRVAPEALHVIAEPAWAPWLEGRGLSGDRVRMATDVAGQPLELNYFLESPHAIVWIASKQFGTIIGAAPHSQYNDQVKRPFEERLCLFLGSGRFVAHTLPFDYLYFVDLPMLLRRCGRDRKVEEYRATTRAIVDDWYGQWIAAGRPGRADGDSAPSMISAMRRHWPAAEKFGDETQRLEPAGVDAAESLAPLVKYLDGVIEEYARRIGDAKAGFDDLLRRHEERVEAVILRDKLLADISNERLKERVLRLLKRR